MTTIPCSPQLPFLEFLYLFKHLQILNLASLSGQVGGTGLQGDAVLCRMRPAEGALSFWYL